MRSGEHDGVGKAIGSEKGNLPKKLFIFDVDAIRSMEYMLSGVG